VSSSDPAPRPGIDVHQYYTLDIPSTASAALADIYSFSGSRGMGEPTKYTIQFTHPQRDLPRGDYIGKISSFSIQPPLATHWSTPEAARRVHGVITRLTQIASNHEQTLYEVTLESRLALLRNTPRTRFFLGMSEPEIIRQILEEHEFNQLFADFSFNLYRTYRKRPIITQWCEDDLTFISRLCRRVGIWFVCQAGERCEQVRFGDDVTHYVHDRERFAVPLLEPSSLHPAGRESISSLSMRSAMVPARFSVRSYSPEQPNNSTVSDTQQVSDDSTPYGETYTWGLDLADEQDSAREAQLRHEAALAQQVVYSGTCDMLDIGPSCVLELSNRELPDVRHGLLVVSMTCSASRKQGYKVEFEAIPCERQYRMPLKEDTWPRIEGVVTGTIAATKDYVGPYLDGQGRYIVNLHADRDARTPGLESCPMRLAKPFAGAGQTGFHFGLEAGTIVTVAFLWGNPDLPFISQVLHTAKHTDPVVSGFPWAQRNTLRTRSNNTLQMEDRKGQEHIKLATEHGKTQLNLGFAVDRENAARNEGYELRTDMHGVLRAAKGLYFSADAQPRANGQALDMRAAMEQLRAAQARMRSLSDAVQRARAVVAECEAQKSLLETQLKDLQQAVLLASAPHGVAITSGEHMQFSAGAHLFTTAGGNADTAVGGNYTVAAGRAVSLYADTQGMKLYSAAGKIDVQAQGDSLNLAALKGVTIASTNDSITLNASKSLTLLCGGSYIKLSSAGVEIGSPFDVAIKGPLRIAPSATQREALPLMPQQEATGMQLWHAYLNGEPVKNAPFKVTFPDGSTRSGTLDANGRGTINGVPAGGGAVQYFEEAHDLQDPAHKFADPKGTAQAATGADAGDAALPSLAGAALAATGGIPAVVPKAVEAFAAAAMARLDKPTSRA
jgi:type VI secretion system secreted protein VgrG